MGSDSSRFDISQMPPYYVEEPLVSFQTTTFLERSLRSVIQGSPSNKVILPFTQFYSCFFDRFFELFDDDEEERCCGLETRDMEDKSLFLILLLKFVVKSPMYCLTARKNGKWQTTERRRLKKFIAQNRDLTLDAYAPIGEAIFYAVSQCDELYSKWVRKAWIEAYSLFLKQVAMIVFKDGKRKKSHLVYEERDALDWSDDHFSDCSPCSTDSSSSPSCSTPGSNYCSDDDSLSREKTPSKLAVRLAKLKIKKKLRKTPEEIVRITLNSPRQSNYRSRRRNSWSNASSSCSAVTHNSLADNPMSSYPPPTRDRAVSSLTPTCNPRLKHLQLGPNREYTDPTAQRHHVEENVIFLQPLPRRYSDSYHSHSRHGSF